MTGDADLEKGAPSGLRYYAVDLHVHTPASECFADKSVTGRHIVDAAIAAGLEAIAIADHNSAQFIDEVKTAAQGTGLVVFPGVEITAKGGKDGIHVLAIFDSSADSRNVRDLLSRVHISPDQYGMDTAIADDVSTTIREIQASAAIAILAHANSSKGVMCDMQGQYRTQVFREEGLLAVEVTDSDFSEDKKSRGKRAVDLLAGSDANYANRKLAVIQGSDCSMPGVEGHVLSGVGQRHTLIKAGQPLTLEGLRQAFIDADSRIRLTLLHGDGLPPLPQPRIVSVKVNGGFFDGLDLEFHPGMNSIIGGKGSGKSLLIELMRFGLSAEATNPEIHKDHLGKLERRLERFGEITLDLVDGTGTARTLTRTYDFAANSPYADEDQRLSAEDFPALFLSQNEIIRIAESDEEQLAFIDRFFDFRSHQRVINQLTEELLRLDDSMADSLRARHEQDGLAVQAASLDRRIEGLDLQLKNEVFTSYEKAVRKSRTLNGIAESAKSILQLVADLRETIGLTTNPTLDASLADDPAVKRAMAALDDTRASALEQLAFAAEKVKSRSSQVASEVEKFSPLLKAEETKYKAMVLEAGGDYKALSDKRASLATERNRLQVQIDAVSARAAKLKTTAEARREKLSALSEAHKAYSQERRDKCADIEKFSAGRLKIAVQEATDSSQFRKRLGAMKKGSYLRDEEISQIVENVKPSDFVAALLNYHIAAPDRKAQIIDRPAKATGIAIDRMKQLADHLLQSRTYQDLLGLQHQATPQDRPDIRVLVADAIYEPLVSVSTGQKCTALLVMALAQGNAPVVIDQPEDSLDIKSIWDDMCTKLRAGKSSRQFVCTTHNSSLAVASDSDCFIVLQADAASGRVVKAGAIDDEPVKAEIIDYLEGGIKTYGVKYRKYDMGRLLRG